MKKLSLRVDALRVESFATDEAATISGTVEGHALTNYGAQTCNGYPANTCVGHATCFTCNFTQCGTCGDCTQAVTCGSCNQQTCGCGPDIPPEPGGGTGGIWSAAYTDCGNCQVSVNEIGTCIAPC